MVCNKCFESNDEGAEFCRDCGAPLVKGSEGSDQEVYKELAKANLHRMRGDMKSANDVCLGILRRYPNNATAHGLLGDISADQGDLNQAATWYEMALELAPDSVADRQKFESVKERVRLKDAQETASQIGIPQRAPSPWPYVVIVVLTVVGVAIGAFFIGQSARKGDSGTVGSGVVQTPVEQPKDEVKPTIPSPKEDPPIENQRASTQVMSDTAILNVLNAKTVDKINYLSVAEDPRGQSAIVTVSAIDQEQYGITATKAGLEFFESFPAFKRVTIRVMGPSGFLLVADMTVEAATTVKASIMGGASVESQAQVALSSTWTPPHAPETPATTGN